MSSFKVIIEAKVIIMTTIQNSNKIVYLDLTNKKVYKTKTNTIN